MASIIKIVAAIIFTLSSCKGDDVFYICNGKQSRAYHSTRNSKGLTRCSTELEQVGNVRKRYITQPQMSLLFLVYLP